MSCHKRESTDVKLYNIYFTDETHSLLKEIAARNKTTIRDLTESVFELFLSDQFPANLKSQAIFVAGRKTVETQVRAAEKRKNTLHSRRT